MYFNFFDTFRRETISTYRKVTDLIFELENKIACLKKEVQQIQELVSNMYVCVCVYV